MKKAVLFVFVTLFSFFSQAQFSLEGDIRPRAEFREGYRQMPSEDDDPALLVTQRTRLIFAFASDRVTTKVSLQNARIWGQQLPLSHQPSIDLHEAWIQLAFNESLSLKLGRQEIRYDNQRLFAVNDWNNIAQKHDAVVLQHSGAKSEWHIGAAFNQSSERLFGTAYYLNTYKTLNYFWYKTGIGPKLNVSLLAVADGYEHPDNPGLLYMRTTGSVFLEFKPSPGLTFRANPAIQGGKARWGQDIKAYYMMAEGVAKISDRFQTGLGVELHSGNNYENPDVKNQAFDPLYGAGHAVHGYMDYFTDVVGSTRGAGLVNPYLKNVLKLTQKNTFEADLHLFFTHKKYVYQGIAVDKYLGTEADLTLSHQFNPVTSISFGYSVMFGTQSLEVLKGGNKDELAHWAYVMLRFRPKFL